MEIEMSFQNDTELLDFNEEYFDKVAKVILNHLKLDGYFIFEVNLVDLKTIHSINKEYRNIDRPTDVISFAFEDDFEGETKIIGDIPREYNHSLTREMTFLFNHGLLHLLGYDHMEVEDEKVMFKLQDEIMEILHL